jgi:prevent-host-death family protein
MFVGSVTEAKAQLSMLLERVCAGEEVIIARAGKPIARLVPFRADRVPRKPGALTGRIRMADDFDELPPDIAEAFGMVKP